MTASNKKDTVWEIVKDVTFCMFATHDGEQVRSRPMTLKSDESAGEFQFLASASSSTVAEIGDNPEVNLAFAEPDDQAYVSVSGHAAVSQDRALIRSLWSSYADTFFPGGAEDADVAVIRVTPHRAEYWGGESHEAEASWNFLEKKTSHATRTESEHAKVDF